jgi:basic amino acid/polyamine antiporter, APA family
MKPRNVGSDLADPRDSAKSATLLRQLGLPASTALVIGGTIGVGIFLTPAGMARSLASPALLLLVWSFIGGAALCGALCFGELAARFPEAGGGYVYLREAYGQGVAFLYGWKCLLVMDPGLTAALAAGLGAYVHAMAPTLSLKIVAMAAIFIVAVANVAGVRLAAGVGNFLALAKIAILILLVGWGFLSGAGNVSHLLPLVYRRPGAPPILPAMAGALISAFFSFGGWWELTKLAGEIKEPQRNLPRALALGVVTVTLLYVAVSAVFLYLVPMGAVASSEAFASQVGSALFGNTGGLVLSGIVSLSVLGSLFAFMTMAPRVYYAMAQDGVVPAFVARLNPNTGAPVRAIAVQASLALFLVAVGTFERIVAYFVFVTVAFLGLTVVGLFRIRRKSTQAGYSTPLYPLTPVLFLACIVLVMALLAAGRPLEVLLGVAVVSLGWPAYYLFFRNRTTQT